ncbi:MAG: 1-acyl-sn-glycerol-3-phosphate acyltransferase [Acidobacteriota bacterium]|nr:1-acyl-sn-glycerol-3-phosphate acyltransferase [Acidobacteriota bacterium]
MRVRNFFSLLRALFFTDILIYLYTCACGAASLAGSIFDSNGRWQHGCARLWSRLILRTSRIQLKVEGLENIPSEPAAIFCSNHPSAMDIPILFVCLPVNFRFVAKRSLFDVPFLGWHLRRSGHVAVERDKPHKAVKSLDQAATRIRDGCPVVLFAEGHRNRRDGSLGPFKRGSFYLAIKSGAPVVPVTIKGSREVLPPDSLHVRAGTVEIIFHRPIPTSALTLADVDSLSDRVRAEIISRLPEGGAAEASASRQPLA